VETLTSETMLRHSDHKTNNFENLALKLCQAETAFLRFRQDLDFLEISLRH
jgi:hypothetical protein